MLHKAWGGATHDGSEQKALLVQLSVQSLQAEALPAADQVTRKTADQQRARPQPVKHCTAHNSALGVLQLTDQGAACQDCSTLRAKTWAMQCFTGWGLARC